MALDICCGMGLEMSPKAHVLEARSLRRCFGEVVGTLRGGP